MNKQDDTKLTVEWLKEMRACNEAIVLYRRYGEVSAIEALNMLLEDEYRNLDWANWLVTRLLSRRNKIRYAIFAAEQVLDLYEKRYPNDDRPRKAIEAAKEVLQNRDTNAAYAAAAAYAAYAAAADADAAYAAYAAYAAAAYAAYAYAADAAAAYAYAYAAAAADAYAADAYAAAAKSAMKEQIIRYGIDLYNKQVLANKELENKTQWQDQS